jgi:hypothetical protein|nr:MAG TPA: hypothetical protein [Caudoviricetes sp.]
MQEKNIVFKKIIIEPLTIYTQDKFKLKIKLYPKIPILATESILLLTTESGEKIEIEGEKNE